MMLEEERQSLRRVRAIVDHSAETWLLRTTAYQLQRNNGEGQEWKPVEDFRPLTAVRSCASASEQIERPRRRLGRPQ